MFAVVKTGGKQYKVQANDIIEVEKIEAGVGSTVVLENVGSPNVAGFGVAAEIIKQKKGDKVIVFKKKRRHNYRRKNGHRQLVTVLKIKEIGKGLKSNILEFKPYEPAQLKKIAKADKLAQEVKTPKTAAKKAATKTEKPGAKKAAKPTAAKKKAAGKTATKAEQE